MADYYYARVRTYKSSSLDGENPVLTEEEFKNNRITSDPITMSDGAIAGTGALNPKAKKEYVYYSVNVWKTSTSDFAYWQTLQDNLKGTKLVVMIGFTMKIKLPPVDTVYTTSNDVEKYLTASDKSGTIVNVGSYTQQAHVKNNSGKPRSVTPTIEVKYTPVNNTNDPALSQPLPVNGIWWDNDAKKAPSIKITKVAVKPPIPNTVQQWLEKAWPDGPSVGATVAEAKKYSKDYISIIGSGGSWSQCKNKWYYLVRNSNDLTLWLWESDKTGSTYKPVLGNKPSFSDNTKKTAWNTLNEAELKKAIDQTNCDGSQDGVPSPETSPDINVEVTPPKDANRYNPPPHAASRSVPYHIRSGDNSTDPEKATFAGLLNSANFNSQSAEYISYVKGYKYLERGKIFQDALSASVLNQVNTGGKPPGKGESNQWGFRFMYNPTDFSYSTAANNAIDWTYGSKDTAALLAGNQSIQLQLYLNRIVDLSYLNVLRGNTSNKIGMDVYNQVSPTVAYGRELDDVEIEGILNRGTEYDLEFLYRCLTGDPQTNNPLLNDTLRKRGSADIGYITGIPLWLYLNDNLRYFGAVAGFEVNHLIFNTEMVPTLSVVTLSFGRYPAQFANDAASLQSVRDNFFPPATDN